MKTPHDIQDAGEENLSSPPSAVEAAPVPVPVPVPTPKKAVDLTNISGLKVRTNMQCEVDFKEGIKFTLNYINRPTLIRTMQSCMENIWNDRTKAREPRLNNDRFTREFCSVAVKGWSGVTLRALSRLAPVDTSSFDDEQMDAAIPFSFENLIFCMKNIYDLDDFLQAAATDVKFFPAIGKQEEETKNS